MVAEEVAVPNGFHTSVEKIFSELHFAKITTTAGVVPTSLPAEFEILTQPTPLPRASITTMPDTYHDIESHIADAILELEKCENPNIVAVA